MVNEILLPHYSQKSASVSARHWEYGRDCKGEVAEALEGDAVTISISQRFLSHGTVTHILSTNLFILASSLMCHISLPQNLSTKSILGCGYEKCRLSVTVMHCD